MTDAAPARTEPASKAWLNAWTAVLLVLLPALACRRGILFAALHRPRTCDAFNHLVLHDEIGAYTRGALSLNYFDHGFIRRGLGGTLLRIIDVSPLAGCVDELLVFHLLLSIWLAIPVVLLVRHALRENRASGTWLAILLAASPQLFLAWGGDIGRIDMFVAGCLAWGILALVQGSLWAAAASILFGVLAHENTAIYGIPLLAAVYASNHPRADYKRAYLPAAVLLGGIAAIFLAHLAFTSANTQDIVGSVVRGQSPSYKRDFAAYIAVTGARGIATSLCQSLGRPATPFYIASTLAVIAVYWWLLRLGRRDAIWYLLITVLPFCAVSMVAVDYGRWLSFAVLNGWLFAVARSKPDRPTIADAPNNGWRIIVLIALIAMRPTHVYYPNYFARWVAKHIWSENETKLKTIEECDPEWRDRIGLPGASDDHAGAS